MTQENTYLSRMSAERDAAEEKLAATRAALATDLRRAGVTEARVYYEGYSDSGNIEGYHLTPSDISLCDDLHDRLENFCWDFAYSYNPGFEIDCGGGGELEWDLQRDKIDLSYCDYGYEEAEPELHRDQ
ncbi:MULTISPECIES: hypothetical protein [unclassified Sulfitobacter]|uniref:hypothetical protein n=1 Tax=unclassified Sulfitobacter TaxID=196795 RepID=UPI0037463A4F